MPKTIERKMKMNCNSKNQKIVRTVISFATEATAIATAYGGVPLSGLKGLDRPRTLV